MERLMATEPKSDQGTEPKPQGRASTEPRQDQNRSGQPQRRANSGQDADPTQGVGDELRARHEARTTVPGCPGVDARLDNRSGIDRPPLEGFPAKPQQVDGPDVAHQTGHTAATLRDRADKVIRKGQFSPGPHGLSDESLREGETTFGTEGLTVGEAGKGAKGG